MGEFGDSGRAAALAVELVARACRQASGPSLEALALGLEAADRAIGAAVTGATTATVAWVSGRQLHYASVGDSRLYHQPAGGRMVQVTRDEGEANVLDNWLGHRRPDRQRSVVRQRGTLALAAGDRLLLLTDGVTGDRPPDLLSPAELAAAVAGADPQAAAEALVRAARKVDDRTAVVIVVP